MVAVARSRRRPPHVSHCRPTEAQFRIGRTTAAGACLVTSLAPHYTLMSARSAGLKVLCIRVYFPPLLSAPERGGWRGAASCSFTRRSARRAARRWVGKCRAGSRGAAVDGQDKAPGLTGLGGEPRPFRAPGFLSVEQSLWGPFVPRRRADVKTVDRALSLVTRPIVPPRVGVSLCLYMQGSWGFESLLGVWRCVSRPV